MNRQRTQAFGNFGVDYYHTSKYVTFAIGGVFMFDRGMSKQLTWHKIIDVGIGFLFFSAADSITFNYLTRQ